MMASSSATVGDPVICSRFPPDQPAALLLGRGSSQGPSSHLLSSPVPLGPPGGCARYASRSRWRQTPRAGLVILIIISVKVCFTELKFLNLMSELTASSPKADLTPHPVRRSRKWENYPCIAFHGPSCCCITTLCPLGLPREEKSEGQNDTF